MSTERHEIWKVADGLQMDIRNASTKLVELRARLAGLDLPDAPSVTCPKCDYKVAGPMLLAEHLYNVHDGPEPAHYATAEERSAA